MQYNIYQIPSRVPFQEALIGKNTRNILIVLGKGAYQAHADLLRRIMQSVGLDLEHDCIVLPIEEEAYIPFHKLREMHEINDVLIFGEFLNHLGIQARTPGNAPFTFARARFLRTFPLPELTSDQNRKRQLWSALKLMFQPE